MGNPGQFFKSNFTGIVPYFEKYEILTMPSNSSQKYCLGSGLWPRQGRLKSKKFLLFKKKIKFSYIFYRSGRKQNMARQYHLPHKIFHQEIWYQGSFSMEF